MVNESFEFLRNLLQGSNENDVHNWFRVGDFRGPSARQKLGKEKVKVALASKVYFKKF